MKHTILALAALAFASTAAAQAQSGSNVTVYGLIDAGVEYTTNANAAKDGVARVTSGGMNTSRWGLRGSEDLGGGLAAVFNLEGGILLDSGASDGVLFKRQANVGLQGRLGKVVVGRSFSTAYDFMLPFDPMGYSANYSWVTSGSATGASKYGMTTAFDNLVKYQGQFGDVKVGATLGLGEKADSHADSAKYAVGAAYARGPLSFAGTFERVNGDTVAATGMRTETSALHLAAAFESGAYKVSGGMRQYKLEAAKQATADVAANTYWGGVNYRATPALTVSGALYYQDVRKVAAGADADPVMYVARAKYALSKRTDLYATVGHTKGRNGKLVGLSRDDAGFGGEQSGVVAGIQHRF